MSESVVALYQTLFHPYQKLPPGQDNHEKSALLLLCFVIRFIG